LATRLWRLPDGRFRLTGQGDPDLALPQLQRIVRMTALSSGASTANPVRLELAEEDAGAWWPQGWHPGDRGTAYGNVSVVSNSTAYGGGLVGEFTNYNAVATLTASSAVGNVYVDASTAYAGGLVGIMQGSTTMELGKGSSASGRVSAVDSTNTSTSHYAGGLVGSFSGGRISNASASGAVTSRYMAGGLVGNYSGSQVATNLNASGDVTVSGSTTLAASGR
jgi:hypothetical protein